MKPQTVSYRRRTKYAPWTYNETEHPTQAGGPALKARLLRARNKMAPRGREKGRAALRAPDAADNEKSESVWLT